MHTKLRFLLILLWMILPVTAAQIAVAKPSGNNVGTSQSTKIKSGTKVNTHKSPAPAKAKEKAPQKRSLEERREAIGKALQSILEIYSTQKATALSYCEEAMALLEEDDPETIRANLMLMCMELYSRNDRPKDVLALAERMNATFSDTKIQMSICFLEATALTKLNEWTAARKKYESCPNQEDSMLMSNVAELYMIEGDSKGSVEAYRKSLERAPDNPHAIFGLATALDRAGAPEKAKAAFLKGVETDPAFSYLKEAFFEPKAEPDFQTAFRMYEGHRFKEAQFYLNRYISMEERPAYKAHGKAMLEHAEADLKSDTPILAATYPVVLSNVRASAISADARYLAFAALERKKADDYKSVIWTLDTATGKPFREAEFANEIIFDLAFVGDSTELRALSTQHRYALDSADNAHDYYIYDNNSELLSVALNNSGKDILAMTPNGLLTSSPWSNPYAEAPLLSVPSNLSRLKVSADNQTSIITTATKTEVFDNAKQEVLKTFPRAFYATVIAAHPQKNLFALGIQSGAILVDDAGRLIDFFATPGQVVSLALAPSGRYLMTFSEQTAEIWRLQPEIIHEEQKP